MLFKLTGDTATTKKAIRDYVKKLKANVRDMNKELKQVTKKALVDVTRKQVIEEKIARLNRTIERYERPIIPVRFGSIIVDWKTLSQAQKKIDIQRAEILPGAGDDVELVLLYRQGRLTLFDISETYKKFPLEEVIIDETL